MEYDTVINRNQVGLAQVGHLKTFRTIRNAKLKFEKACQNVLKLQNWELHKLANIGALITHAAVALITTNLQAASKAGWSKQ